MIADLKKILRLVKSEKVWQYKNTQKYPVGSNKLHAGYFFVADIDVGNIYDFLKIKVCDSPFLNVIRCTLPS